MSKDDKNNYEIGYGKPPKSSQFKKGQSGNPKGRPKGQKNTNTVMRDIMEEKVSIGDYEISTRDALFKVLIHAALKERNLRAFKILLDIDTKSSPEYYSSGTKNEQLLLIQQLQEELAESRSKEGGVLLAPARVSPEEWHKLALELKDKMLSPGGDIKKDYRGE